MSSSEPRSAPARPAGESVFGSPSGPVSHPTRADDSVGGVVRFALIAASILGLTSLAVAVHRLWLGELADAQLGLAGNGLYTEALVFLCLGVAAHAAFRRNSRESLLAAAVLYTALGFVFAQYYAALLAGPTPVALRPSWSSILLLVFVLLVPAPLVYHFGLLLFMAFVTPVSTAVWLLLGWTATFSDPHPAPALAQRMIVSMLPTWICIIVAGAIALHRDRERRRWRELAEQLLAARGRLQELGAYTLERRLGIGGMGEVWQATHRVLARPAAIKLISAKFLLEQAGNPTNVERFLARFEQEARVTARLNSPHTVQVYDYGHTEDGQLYYVMELLQGADLARVVKCLGPLPPARVVHWLRQLCDSLMEAHSLGLVHRDLKPANIFLCRQGAHHEVVKLLDFGLALTGGQCGGFTGKLLDTGVILGSPHFMAPEQARDDAEIDGRADLYALGCVAWYLLTGGHVFQATASQEVLRAQLETEPQALASACPGPLDPRLASLIHRLLAKNPDDRPQNADLLALELAELNLPRPQGHLLNPELLADSTETDYLARRTRVLVQARTTKD